MKTANAILIRLVEGERIRAFEVPSRDVFWLRDEGFIQYRGSFIEMTEIGRKEALRLIRRRGGPA